MAASGRIKVLCPCCQTTLLVDSATGLVLNKSSKKPDYSFEEALEQVKVRKEKTDELFAKAFDAEKRRHETLEKKFQQALESKDELEDPVRPLDLD